MALRTAPHPTRAAPHRRRLGRVGPGTGRRERPGGSCGCRATRPAGWGVSPPPSGLGAAAAGAPSRQGAGLRRAARSVAESARVGGARAAVGGRCPVGARPAPRRAGRPPPGTPPGWVVAHPGVVRAPAARGDRPPVARGWPPRTGSVDGRAPRRARRLARPRGADSPVGEPIPPASIRSSRRPRREQHGGEGMDERVAMSARQPPGPETRRGRSAAATTGRRPRVSCRRQDQR